MKTSKIISSLCLILGFTTLVSGCFLFPKKDPEPVVSDYKKAIDAKYKQLAWSQLPDNGGEPFPTQGQKGWVLYYGNRSRAIYYYPSTGAFGLMKAQLEKYDAIGQETFRNSEGHLGYPTSDSKSCGANCQYNDFQNGILLTTPSNSSFLVYGDIYQKYKSLNLWDGILGLPTTDELDLTSKKGRYNGFAKGQIFYSTTTGAQAFWGGIQKLYGNTGFDTGWLGLPIESCDPAKGLYNQGIKFQNGRIILNESGSCGLYFNTTPLQVLNTGKSGSPIPCYDAR